VRNESREKKSRKAEKNEHKKFSLKNSQNSHNTTHTRFFFLRASRRSSLVGRSVEIEKNEREKKK